jgi:hypothetical protein
LLSANLPNPIAIKTPSEVLELFKRDTTPVNLAASLDVKFPVFIVYDGFGFGATIEYE